MLPYGSRARRLPAPPHVVWESLADPPLPGARPWLDLLDREVEPTVLRGERPLELVWSSLWSVRPDDVVLLELAPTTARRCSASPC